MLVRVPAPDSEMGEWTEHCYRILPASRRHEPILLQRLIIQHTCLRAHPTERPIPWHHWDQEGTYFIVQTHTVEGMTAHTARQYTQAFAPAPPPPTHTALVLTSLDKSKITSHFPTFVIPPPTLFTLSVKTDEMHPTTPRWSGHAQHGLVTFDWESMNPRVESDPPFLQVAR